MMNSRKIGWLFVGLAALLLGGMAAAQGMVDGYKAITADQLMSPADGDWIMFRRTYNEWGYSPLDQVTTENVGNLQLAWAWTMENGRQETTPLVHDGTMFLHNFGDKIQALDATNGNLIWEYARSLPSALEGKSANLARTMALAGDKLYFVSADMFVVALDAASGKVAWETGIGNYNLGYAVTGGPIVANGVVVTGVSGCGSAEPGGCFIAGVDAESGEFLWKTDTIARPGTPEGDTWNGIPLDSRYGASAWNVGSYDADTDTVFWNVGQPYPWIAEMNGLLPVGAGNKNNALYTDSTLALDPRTGEVKWYHQWLQTDTWDLDYAYEPMLIDLTVDGAQHKALVTTGKLGIVEAIDRETGDYLFSHETVYQNVVQSIDPATGMKTINPDAIPHIGQTTTNCPGDPGSRSWAATSYNPDTNMLYLPMQEFCVENTPNPLGPGEVYTGGGAATFVRSPIPNSDGNMGKVAAVDLGNQTTAWEYRTRAPNGAVATLSTGGGLVFSGNIDRTVFALDAKTGDVLWQQRVNTTPAGFPITYEAGGKQYVAFPVGAGAWPPRAFNVLAPEITFPDGGSTLWVFALPDGM